MALSAQYNRYKKQAKSIIGFAKIGLSSPTNNIIMKNNFKVSIFILAACIMSCLQLSGQVHLSVVEIYESSSFSTSTSLDEDGIKASFGDYVVVVPRENSHRELWISNGRTSETRLLYEASPSAIYLNFLEAEDFIAISVFDNSAIEDMVLGLNKTTLEIDTLFTSPEFPGLLTYFDDDLFYRQNAELWRYDMDSGSTELVHTFASFQSFIDMDVLNDQLILIGGGSSATQLFTSDGTSAGTQSYFQLNTGNEFSRNYHMTPVGDKMFFFFESNGNPYSLYVTDGTTEGTQIVGDFEDLVFEEFYESRKIIGFQDKLYFKGRPTGTTQGSESLWVSDGTPNGTQELSNASPSFFTVYNDELYFRGESGFGSRIYKTDGTSAGTSIQLDRDSGFGLSLYRDSLWFSGFLSGSGSELVSWRPGTTDVNFRHLNPGSNGCTCHNFVSTGDKLFFIARNPESGMQLHLMRDAEDFDQDGVLSHLDCNDEDAEVNPNAEEIAYNGKDDDCNPGTRDDDLDGDGFLLVDDCDDLNASINPDAEEIPNNGVDEDCDGEDLANSTIESVFHTYNAYPNPVNDIFTIDGIKIGDFKIMLYNNVGMEIKVVDNNTIDVSNLAPGLYFLSFQELRTGSVYFDQFIVSR